MQTTSTATAPRRSTMDEYIRLHTTQTPTPSVLWERAAVMAAAAMAEARFGVMPAASTVFASFPFNAKAGM